MKYDGCESIKARAKKSTTLLCSRTGWYKLLTASEKNKSKDIMGHTPRLMSAGIVACLLVLLAPLTAASKFSDLH